MSEEQQTTAQQCDAAESPASVTETVMPAVEADETTEQAAADQESPAEVKVFGMSRSRFHATVLGIAAGFFVSGFAGILFQIELNPTVSVVICAVIGFLISYLIDRRREKNTAQNNQ